MNAEKVIYYLLRNDAAVVALVGPGIWPETIKQGEALPQLAFAHVSSVDLSPVVHAGAFTLTRSRIQVTAHDKDLAAVKRLLQAVRLALVHRSGTFAGVDVQYIRRDLAGPAIAYADPDRWAQSIDFMVTFNEPNQ